MRRMWNNSVCQDYQRYKYYLFFHEMHKALCDNVNWCLFIIYYNLIATAIKVTILFQDNESEAAFMFDKTLCRKGLSDYISTLLIIFHSGWQI